MRSHVLMVRVGSTNGYKVSSVKNICNLLSPGNNEVIGFPADSKVSNMPFGLQEMVTGATNRATAVWIPGTIAVGIESGLEYLIPLPWWKRILSKIPVLGERFLKNVIFICLSVVCVIAPNGEKIYSTSSGMITPSEVVIESMKRGWTTGQVLADWYGGDEHDPRYILSYGRVCRQDSLEDAVKHALVFVL